MNLKIIKYNAGNIQSVLFALERIGVEAMVTDNIEEIRSADKVIFPGVGEASTAMHYLKERKLDQVIKYLEQPVLGVCLGMQLMCSYSDENDTECLGIFEERVKKFRTEDDTGDGAEPAFAITKEPRVRIKVPQIGWNNIYDLKSGIFGGLTNNSYCYFVHSYYAALGEHTIATTDYIQPYSAALSKGNFYGVQFHPEKSAEVGETILRNFLDLN